MLKGEEAAKTQTKAELSSSTSPSVTGGAGCNAVSSPGGSASNKRRSIWIGAPPGPENSFGGSDILPLARSMIVFAALHPDILARRVVWRPQQNPRGLWLIELEYVVDGLRLNPPLNQGMKSFIVRSTKVSVRRMEAASVDQ
jgi:hypothetical protein